LRRNRFPLFLVILNRNSCKQTFFRFVCSYLYLID
jgi:hypothetical protein